MADNKFVLYEPIEDGRIVRIMLNRPKGAGPRRTAGCWSS